MNVQRTLVGLLLASLLVAFATPTQAGTEAAPEITDPAGDQALTPAGEVTVPETEGAAGTGADIQKAWFSDTATDLDIFLVGGTTNAWADGTAGPYLWTVNFNVGGTAYSATATSHPEADAAPPTPGGVATVATVEGTLLHLKVPKTAIGNPAAGAAVTEFFVVGSETLGASPLIIVEDRAPDGEDFGGPYAMTGGAGNTTGNNTAGNPNGAPGCTYKPGETNKTDSDADCLPDSWENTNIGNLGQNGTNDPDADGCDNKCEYLAGSNPNAKPVTTGTNTSTGTGTGTSTGTSTRSTTSGSTSTGSATTTSDSAIDKILTDQQGYTLVSAAAAGTLLILSLIGRFGRWGA